MTGAGYACPSKQSWHIDDRPLPAVHCRPPAVDRRPSTAVQRTRLVSDGHQKQERGQTEKFRIFLIPPSSPSRCSFLVSCFLVSCFSHFCFVSSRNKTSASLPCFCSALSALSACSLYSQFPDLVSRGIYKYTNTYPISLFFGALPLFFFFFSFFSCFLFLAFSLLVFFLTHVSPSSYGPRWRLT